KLLVSALSEMDGAAAEELEPLLAAVLEELLLHAATARHATTGSATTAAFLALRGTALRGTGIIKPPRVIKNGRVRVRERVGGHVRLPRSRRGSRPQVSSVRP